MYTESEFSAVLLSIKVSCASTLINVIPSTLLGVWLARSRSPLRFLVELVIMSPLVVPPVVIGLLLLMAMHRVCASMVFTFWAATVAGAVVSMPLFVRLVRTSIEQIDPRFSSVAATLGASRWRALWTITLPLAWRGIVGGALLAWARTVGEFGATIVVAGNIEGITRTIPLAVWTKVQSPTAPFPTVLVAASLALAVGALALSEILTRPVRRRPRLA